MYRYIPMAIMLVLCLVVLSAMAASNNAHKQIQKIPLKLTLSTVPNANYRSSNLPLKITFQNVSDKNIRIVDYFKDAKALPVFFTFEIKRDDGITVFNLGGGKISFARGQIKYVELKKNEKFDTLINLADIVPVESKLQAGVYSVFVTYHNQYGEDCIKGFIDGNTVTIKITE